MDVHSKEKRSQIMSAIRSVGTKDEVRLGKALWSLGLRYRKNDRSVFGKPDFTFKKVKLAIFVDSEFFHGKDFQTRKKPATNTEFWNAKILRNMARDKQVNQRLENDGWTVIRLWSAEIRKNTTECAAYIKNRHTQLQNDKKDA